MTHSGGELLFVVTSSANNVASLQQAALDEYGADLHIALRSRKDELLYLRKLTEMLFPYVMPPKATDCRYTHTSAPISPRCEGHSLTVSL